MTHYMTVPIMSEIDFLLNEGAVHTDMECSSVL